MKKNTILILAFLIVWGFGLQSVSAQFPVKIPKLPKVDKTKQEQPPKTNGTSSAERAEPNEAAPTQSPQTQPNPKNNARTKAEYIEPPVPTGIALFLKDTLEIKIQSRNKYWKFPNQRYYSNWIPQVYFEVFYDNSSRLRYTAEWSKPDGSLWFSESLDASEGNDSTMMVKSLYNGDLFDNTSTDQAGKFGLKITDNKTKEVIYQGKFNVKKSIDTPGDPQMKNAFQFFVDNDWNLAVGYAGFRQRQWYTNSSLEPTIYLWFKGLPQVKDLEARLFYGDRQITSTDDGGGIIDQKRRGDGCARGQEVCVYGLYSFNWSNFLFEKDDTPRSHYPNVLFSRDQPGEYTIKVFHKGVQVREAKFTIAPNGGIAKNNISDGIYPSMTLIPVKVLGTAEKWNPISWKTDMFYGNPVAGFNVQ